MSVADENIRDITKGYIEPNNTNPIPETEAVAKLRADFESKCPELNFDDSLRQMGLHQLRLFVDFVGMYEASPGFDPEMWEGNRE